MRGLTYGEVVGIIGNMKCMTPCKSADHRHGTEVFYLRGLRYCVIVDMRINFSQTAVSGTLGSQLDLVFESYSLRWKLKRKNRKSSVDISFEDVLESKTLGIKAQEELLFYLDLFAR